jgi:hypothetical protein
MCPLTALKLNDIVHRSDATPKEGMRAEGGGMKQNRIQKPEARRKENQKNVASALSFWILDSDS